MFSIGNIAFTSPLILAPLAGYSDLPLRILCRRFGAGYCVSEMISCHGLVYRQENTIRMLQSVAEERPVAFQLFGSEPEIMGEAAQILESFGPDMIDINMGCPVRKVTKKGAGAALMTTPDVAKDIIRHVVNNVSVPVTVKIRSGKDSKTRNAVTIAKMAEDCGASAIAVHARTWAQAFSGIIDPAIIRDVKKAVSIPVIGNGDILTYRQAYDLIVNTGCDAAMIGRGALGNPWVFQESGRPTEQRAIVDVALQHLHLIEEYLPAERMLGYIKNQMCRYFKGLPGSSSVRKSIFSASNLNNLKMFLAELAS